MTLQRFSTLAALSAGLCVAGSAQDVAPIARQVHGTQPFHATVAGVCMNKDDFAFTRTPLLNATGGALRIYCDLIGESTHGRLTFIAVAEEDFSPASCTLAGGLSGGFQFPLSGYTIVITFTSEEQLYLRLVSGSECGNPAISPIGIGQSTLKVVGGTGRFAGASGTVSHSWRDGDLLEISPLGGDSIFASFNGTVDGFIRTNGRAFDLGERHFVPTLRASASRNEVGRRAVLAEGRVEMWLGGLGMAYPLPAFRLPVPH